MQPAQGLAGSPPQNCHQAGSVPHNWDSGGGLSPAHLGLSTLACSLLAASSKLPPQLIHSLSLPHSSAGPVLLLANSCPPLSQVPSWASWSRVPSLLGSTVLQGVAAFVLWTGGLVIAWAGLTCSGVWWAGWWLAVPLVFEKFGSVTCPPGSVF